MSLQQVVYIFFLFLKFFLVVLFIYFFKMWSIAPLWYAESILFFSFLSCPPPLCYTVVNDSLVIMEFTWDVDTSSAVFYKAKIQHPQNLVIRILQGRCKFLNHQETCVTASAFVSGSSQQSLCSVASICPLEHKVHWELTWAEAALCSSLGAAGFRLDPFHNLVLRGRGSTVAVGKKREGCERCFAQQDQIELAELIYKSVP